MRAVAVGIGKDADAQIRGEVFELGQVIGQSKIGDDLETARLSDRSGDVLRLNEDAIIVVTDTTVGQSDLAGVCR